MLIFNILRYNHGQQHYSSSDLQYVWSYHSFFDANFKKECRFFPQLIFCEIIFHPDLGALDLRYLWSCQLYFIVLSHACQYMINAKLLNSMAGSHVGIFISAFCGIEHVYRDLHSTTKHLCHNIPIHLLLCWNSSRY